MKRKAKVIINGHNINKIGKKNKILYKLFVVIILIIIFILMLVNTIQTYLINDKFSKEVNDFSKLNTSTIFSIDKIYMYSSATAKSNIENRPVWNLNISQYTDIALYINNRASDGLTYENSIKEMYISDIIYTGPQQGTPGLYYKNVNEFAKGNIIDDNKISDKLIYTAVNEGDIDYSKPQIYSNCQNPITLEYVNSNIKENVIISDITSEMKFDGNLLRKSAIFLDTINCTVSFKITIINYYNQQFMANVYIDIPLTDTVTNDSIYDGKLVKRLENTNLIKFFRIK